MLESASRGVSGLGGVWSGRGVSAPGGSAPGGGVWGDVCPQGGLLPGGVCLLLGGWYLVRGCLLLGDCLLPGGDIPACTEADPLPPVNRMNDRQV